MNAKKLILFFFVILGLSLGWRLGEDYQMRRFCGLITALSTKFPEFKGVHASRSKPGLISILGRLGSKKDLEKLVTEVQKIMDHQIIFKPETSFAVEFHPDQVETK